MSFLVIIFILLFSSIIHEVMHGWVAYKLGDPTAKALGRLTLNPLPHIDPIMTIIVPLLLILSGSPIIFGAAKPVPINPIFLKDRKKDMALIALAGPLTNIAIAIAASLLLKIFILSPGFFTSFLEQVVIYNLILGIINLIPIPPLDGSRIFILLLPQAIANFYSSLEPFGIFILFFLLLMPIAGFSLADFINNALIFSLKALGVIPPIL